MRVMYALIRRIRLHQLFRAVILAVVADDDLDVAVRLRKRAFERELEEFRPLVRRHEDAHERQRLRRILGEEGTSPRLVSREAFAEELDERLFLPEHRRTQPAATELQALRRIEECRPVEEILAPRQIDLRRHEETVDGEHILCLAEHTSPGHCARLLGEPQRTDAPRGVESDAVRRQDLRARDADETQIGALFKKADDAREESRVQDAHALIDVNLVLRSTRFHRLSVCRRQTSPALDLDELHREARRLLHEAQRHQELRGQGFSLARDDDGDLLVCPLFLLLRLLLFFLQHPCALFLHLRVPLFLIHPCTLHPLVRYQ